RLKLFETIRSFNEGDTIEGYRIWADIFKLYSNKDWTDYRITVNNMTDEEIQAVRRFMSSTDWLVASTIEDIWRVILSGLVYFRIEVLPEFFKVLDPPRIEIEVLLQIVYFEDCVYHSSKQRENPNYRVNHELAQGCEHFWWTVEDKELWADYEEDVR
ncbi:hypothetical protein PMAYCL1PPCAC_08004, partial [Pristionchus mayeri]